ncbi:hypothetical protein J4476_01950 [Candidatus Woesearchaeota archaeon]|nr:hypothetical protein [Candidatus Woesearchaeota archaeon]HIH26140.1 hypothetical protein [Nanoarchaeota archaeon]
MKILFLIILIVILNINIVLGCTCIEESFIHSYNRISTIFTGKVETIKIPKDSIGLAEIRLSVKEYWKQETKKEITVYTSIEECGYNFNKDKEYLVYADKVNKKLTVSLCGRTKELEESKEDLYLLDKGTKPTAEAVTTEIKKEWAAAGILIIVLILMYIVLNINKTKLR